MAQQALAGRAGALSISGMWWWQGMIRRSERARRGVALIALLGLLCNLLLSGAWHQLVTPASAAALAGPVVLCTADGDQRVVWLDASGKPVPQGPTSGHCPDCTTCVGAGCALPALAAAAQPIAWPCARQAGVRPEPWHAERYAWRASGAPPPGHAPPVTV